VGPVLLQGLRLHMLPHGLPRRGDIAAKSVAHNCVGRDRDGAGLLQRRARQGTPEQLRGGEGCSGAPRARCQVAAGCWCSLSRSAAVSGTLDSRTPASASYSAMPSRPVTPSGAPGWITGDGAAAGAGQSAPGGSTSGGLGLGKRRARSFGRPPLPGYPGTAETRCCGVRDTRAQRECGGRARRGARCGGGARVVRQGTRGV